jgi:hypothetical protein
MRRSCESRLLPGYRSRRRAFLAQAVVALPLLVAAGTAAASPAYRGGDPRTIVLQLVDLPSGFDRDAGHYVTNTELAATTTTHKDYRKLGRLSGYYTSYSAIGIGGLTAVSSFASIYRRGAGAHDSLVQSLAEAERQSGVRQVHDALARLGPDAHLFLQVSSQSGKSVDYYTVAWRNGVVFAEVMGAGASGTVDPLAVVALARKQDHRIAKLFS